MLTLEDAVLRNLATRPLLAAEFPFIRVAAQASGCGCRPQPDLNSVKAQIASLAPEGQRRFKELAGTNEIQVIYREGVDIKTVKF